MKNTGNFKNYTVNQLYYEMARTNRELYPDRFEAIQNELARHQNEWTSSTAKTTQTAQGNDSLFWWWALPGWFVGAIIGIYVGDAWHAAWIQSLKDSGTVIYDCMARPLDSIMCHAISILGCSFLSFLLGLFTSYSVNRSQKDGSISAL